MFKYLWLDVPGCYEAALSDKDKLEKGDEKRLELEVEDAIQLNKGQNEAKKWACSLPHKVNHGIAEAGDDHVGGVHWDPKPAKYLEN